MINKKSYKISNTTKDYFGVVLILFCLLNFFFISFFDVEVLKFLSKKTGFLFSFIFGLLGFYLIRSEQSNLKFINYVNLNQ